MKRITIEIASAEERAENPLLPRLDVVLEDGRRCNGLCWGELLEQVGELTHERLGTERYAMKTYAQWAERRERMSGGPQGDGADNDEIPY